jgi:protein archease
VAEQSRPASGYKSSPRTAEVIVAAWAPTVEGCLAQAVHGLVSGFADVRAVRPRNMVAFVCDPSPDEELLVEVLDEAIYLVHAHDVIPVQVAVAPNTEGGLVGEFGVVPRADVTLLGPVPKAVAWHGLRLAWDGSGWRCHVVVEL